MAKEIVVGSKDFIKVIAVLDGKVKIDEGGWVCVGVLTYPIAHVKSHHHAFPFPDKSLLITNHRAKQIILFENKIQ